MVNLSECRENQLVISFLRKKQLIASEGYVQGFEHFTTENLSKEDLKKRNEP